MARVYTPIFPACWIQCNGRSLRSSPETVQNIWNVYLQELNCVPTAVKVMMWTALRTFGAGRPTPALNVHIRQQGEQPLLALPDLLVEGAYLCTLRGVGGVNIVFIVLIMLTLLMSPMRGSSSTRLYPLSFDSDGG